ncbi:hypothetical protein, partial [Nocardia farcinica]|uniref:hypothetical protein n=1 Tax=Nocardia farcinica TaxID=37329 RepID=UPI002456E135
ARPAGFRLPADPARHGLPAAARCGLPAARHGLPAATRRGQSTRAVHAGAPCRADTRPVVPAGPRRAGPALPTRRHPTAGPAAPTRHLPAWWVVAG